MYKSWHDYGYGVNVGNLETDADRLRGLLELAPLAKDEVVDAIENLELTSYESLTIDDFEIIGSELSYTNAELNPVVCIVTQAISEIADVHLSLVTDFDDNHYIIVPFTHPWDLTETMKNWKSDNDIKTLFKKYFDIITDQPFDKFDYDYQAVENGG